MTGPERTYAPAEIYGKAGLIYIRAPSKVEKTKNGRQKIKANPFPNHGLISQQWQYNENSGDYYAMLMGRKFIPGRWVLLLDFDNEEEDCSVIGFELIMKLNMDQYKAPCQRTSSGCFHYLFYADASQRKQITSRTTIEHEEGGGSNTTWMLNLVAPFAPAPRPKLRATGPTVGSKRPPSSIY